MQIYHKCGSIYKILRMLGLAKEVSRLKVVKPVIANVVNYKCEICGMRISVDTDWSDKDLVGEFFTLVK